MPSVLSGDRLFFIDPHERYFQFQGNRTSGYLWNLAERRADISRIPDQFAPFCVSGIGESNLLSSGQFKGTLFRFPLRHTTSELSQTIYNDSRVSKLFAQFKNESKYLLMFLKNITSVEVCVRDENSKNTRTLFYVRLADQCVDDVQKCRTRLYEAIKSRSTDNLSVSYLLVIELVTFDNSSRKPARSCFCRYVVNEYYAGGHVSTTLNELRNDPTLALTPVVGTAFDIDFYSGPTSEQSVSSGTAARITDDNVQYLKGDSEQQSSVDGPPPDTSVHPTGHVFCCLPLSTQQTSSTGLPVHINGLFAVSQDRQHLKWPSTGQPIDSDKSLLWNHCLITELVSVSYRNLIFHCFNTLNLDENIVYMAMPDLMHVDEKWQV